MKHEPLPRIDRVVDLILATSAAPEPGDDRHRDDLVMLGTLARDRAFWSCRLWGEAQQRSDFVHVSRPCSERDPG